MGSTSENDLYFIGVGWNLFVADKVLIKRRGRGKQRLKLTNP